jgi:hypothetical protein
MIKPQSPAAELRNQRPLSVPFTLATKLKIEALETILQQPASTILETAVRAFIAALPDADRKLVESLASRALESVQQSSQAETAAKRVRVCSTVSGSHFEYTGSLDEGIEVLFQKSRPLRITRESIGLIRQEIAQRKGPALMGAIFSPLMPNSIGEAIQKKHRLTPINLSYVIPLLRERGVVRAFKEGRNWYVAAERGAAEAGAKGEAGA